MTMKLRRSLAVSSALLSIFLVSRGVAQNRLNPSSQVNNKTRLAQAGTEIPIPGNPAPLPETDIAPAEPLIPVPPTAQAYVACEPKVEISYGRTMVPVTFLANALGASIGPVDGGAWRVLYFGNQLDFTPYKTEATFNGAPVTLDTAPMHINGTLYLPWAQVAEWLSVKWSIPKDSNPKLAAQRTTMLLQFQAAYIQNVHSSVNQDRVRVVVTLSNPTRIIAGQEKLDVGFKFAGARDGDIPTVHNVGDYLVPRTVLNSGDWRASMAVRLNYSAPVSWFTLGSPPRLVIDVQRLFEEKSQKPLEGGLMLTKIRRGTGHGPVQLWAVKLDPRDGWRIRVAPGGYSVLQRARPSILASRHKAVLAVNGGFFAYDGAAVGAVLMNNEWIRLPWKGRTAVGFTADGKAKIDNLQTNAYAEFSSGLKIPIRDLNGWPDKGRVTALTKRFGTYYKLSPGEMAVVVKNGKVLSTPGGGGAPISAQGFTLVASGGARPWLQKVTRGQKAKLVIQPIGWPKITTALGGGPRLVKNSQIQVTAIREAFRTDVRDGANPRTAFGIDKQGRYIILVADGRKKFYSTGLTLTELAQTMQKLGAVDAMNLDGGGSTSMAVRGRVVNRPSDGAERKVSNALLVMR